MRLVDVDPILKQCEHRNEDSEDYCESCEDCPLLKQGLMCRAEFFGDEFGTAPKVDIVHCGECGYYFKESGSCFRHETLMKEDGFCSLGNRDSDYRSCLVRFKTDELKEVTE